MNWRSSRPLNGRRRRSARRAQEAVDSARRSRHEQRFDVADDGARFLDRRGLRACLDPTARAPSPLASSAAMWRMPARRRASARRSRRPLGIGDCRADSRRVRIVDGRITSTTSPDPGKRQGADPSRPCDDYRPKVTQRMIEPPDRGRMAADTPTLRSSTAIDSSLRQTRAPRTGSRRLPTMMRLSPGAVSTRCMSPISLRGSSEPRSYMAWARPARRHQRQQAKAKRGSRLQHVAVECRRHVRTCHRWRRRLSTEAHRTHGSSPASPARQRRGG